MCLSKHVILYILKAVFHKFYFVHSWVFWPIYNANARKIRLPYMSLAQEDICVGVSF